MIWLTSILLFKIIYSIICLIIPFLFFNKTKLEKLTASTMQSVALFRLYGVAILALLVAYCFGLYQTLQDVFPLSAVWMGVMSNLGASAVLVKTSAWRTSKMNFVVFSVIGLVLLFFGLQNL